jgi:WD40 repeat protein
VSGVETGKLFRERCYDQTVKLWDVRQGRELATLPKQRYVRVSVAFSPVGDTLLAVAVWMGFQLWELPSR